MDDLKLERTDEKTVSLAGDAYANRLLCLSLDIGEKILENGGEINRVEDTIERICRAYGAVHVEVFVIPSLIVASIRMSDNGYSSQSRRVYGVTNHLSRLENYNRISREICAVTPPLDEVDEKIHREKAEKKTPLWMTMLGYAAVAGSFSVLFGGSLRDGIAGGLVAIALALVGQIRTEYINQMARALLTSLLAGLLAYGSVWIGIGEHVDMIMIGTIMLLIPGLAFGNAIRDLLCGDTVAGLLKTVQSCLLAVMIAFGYALPIMLLDDKIVSAATVAVLHPAVEWIVVLLGTIGFCMFFHTGWRLIPVISILGVVNYAVYLLALHVGWSLFVAAFLSGLFFSVCSEVCARVLRAPSSIFLLTIPVAIIPGGSLYYTMSALIMGQHDRFETSFKTTLNISIGIAVGIVAVSVLIRVLMRASAKRKANHF